jgi:hypothetical protein
LDPPILMPPSSKPPSGITDSGSVRPFPQCSPLPGGDGAKRRCEAQRRNVQFDLGRPGTFYLSRMPATGISQHPRVHRVVSPCQQKRNRKFLSTQETKLKRGVISFARIPRSAAAQGNCPLPPKLQHLRFRRLRRPKPCGIKDVGVDPTPVLERAVVCARAT